jgi:hypothetical protein
MQAGKSPLLRSALLCATLAGGGAWASGAQAAVTEDQFQMRSTGDLVALCSAEKADPYMTAAANFCHGFAVGVFQTLTAEQAARRNRQFCVTEPMPTRNEAIASYVTWAKADPARLTLRPADSILAYLIETQPCKSQASSKKATRP